MGPHERTDGWRKNERSAHASASLGALRYSADTTSEAPIIHMHGRRQCRRAAAAVLLPPAMPNLNVRACCYWGRGGGAFSLGRFLAARSRRAALLVCEAACNTVMIYGDRRVRQLCISSAAAVG
uniref:Uncharacterized protein n=1 Tax=Plectus sambesii TaxID=2011161 RepID=A0A914V9X8_9BILA